MKRKLIILALAMPLTGMTQPKPGKFAFYGGPQLSVAVAVFLAEFGYQLNNVHALSLYFLLCVIRRCRSARDILFGWELKRIIC